MQRKGLERFGEWTMIGAATYGTALLGLFTFRALHESLAGGDVHAWWPEFTDPERLVSWIPLALLWGTAFLAPMIWSLDRTNLWKSIPQLVLSVVVSSAVLAATPAWLGALLAVSLVFGMLTWIRRHRNRYYDAPRHSSGYGKGRI